ncbi:DELTA-thalatoxin-Avl2a-like [Stylophora pistillata]|nr:DELTA-thalatoxin-Avl2a-like [Stylophora pistillata]XP_022778970.1 DELTA-thalatoxin-Avl2a-like [Stylophora pistillata]
MMHVPLVLLILVLRAVRERCVATVAENYGLGRVIDLRKVNLLADFQEKENRIFEELPQKCLIKKTLKSSSSHFEYYANTKAFYESLATQSSLSASLQSAYSLGVTVSVATKRKSSKNIEVSGMSLIKQALTEKIDVDKECLLIDYMSTLKGTFIKDLENLPVPIKNPWELNSWREYRTFLNKYGSHAITSVKRGSRFQQMTFAESSKAYSQRDFQVKACVSAAGPTQVGKVGVSACSNVSQSEISKASTMSTSEKRFVKGGKRETNSKLANNATSVELINQLMDEADSSPASVQHTFMAIWTILQSRFKQGSPNNIRATNLEYYYLGFLNFDCPFITSSGLAVQKFDHTTGSSNERPEFECTLAKEGCHNDDDCHYKPFWCSCRGPTCVPYRSVKQGAGDTKETAYANTFEDWGWHGCDWKYAGSWCSCYNKNRDQRKTVWSLPNRDAPAHKASTKTADEKGRGFRSPRYTERKG